jgi:enoyl-CoA hydratase
MTVNVERDGAFVVLTLDRPETKNALDFATFESLRSAFADIARDTSVRAVVLTASGHTFVSGGDLRELRSATTETDAERLLDAGRAVTSAVAELDVPVIAALPGAAIGGGVELALACDMRIAEVRARFQMKHVRMGVTTAWGTFPRLLALVGPGIAARLVYCGHELSSAEAYAFRLVDAVVENGTSVTTALAWAYDITQGSPTAIAQMKALFRERADADFHVSERGHFVNTWVGADHVEAMQAYFERRPPSWKPRTPSKLAF